MCTEFMINSALVLAIGIMTSLLDCSLVVILILGFFVPPLKKDGKKQMVQEYWYLNK